MKSILNILYVGNEKQTLESLQKQELVSLTVMNNNLSAVNFLNDNKKPDAIICDVDLPGNDGFFLFDWLKTQNSYDAVPFILLDTNFNNDVYKLAFNKKVDDYYVSTKHPSNNLVERIAFLCDFKSKEKSSKTIKPAREVYKMPVSKRVFDIL